MNNRIGRYEIQTELGRGGFGRVFRAYDPAVNRSVAIKTLTAAEDPDILRRFRNEASAAGRLRHQNIVIIYDFGEHDGFPYLVMELLEGEDLDKVIGRKQAIDLLQAIDVMLQVAAGLHHAHSRGIIHRDIKPANIMLTRDGSAKVLDFGIALLTHASTASRLTPQGSMLGTLTYMAPEQFQGATPSVVTDIFAYGVTFYKLLTRQHPFQASEMAEQMYRIVTAEPEPLRKLNPACPASLEHSLSRMLAKTPSARYQSFEDVRTDLNMVLHELQQSAAQESLAHARTAIELGHWDDAQNALQRTLKFAPASPEALTLRQNLESLRKAQETRVRVSALVSAAREDIGTQQFVEAIQKLEAARQLDQHDPDSVALLQQARDSLLQPQEQDPPTQPEVFEPSAPIIDTAPTKTANPPRRSWWARSALAALGIAAAVAVILSQHHEPINPKPLTISKTVQPVTSETNAPTPEIKPTPIAPDTKKSPIPEAQTAKTVTPPTPKAIPAVVIQPNHTTQERPPHPIESSEIKSAPVTPPLPAQTDEEGVLQTLTTFSHAVQRKDISAMKQQWPTIHSAILDRWQEKFQNAESISYVLEPGVPQINGTSAHIKCRKVTRESYAGAGEDYHEDRTVQVTLQKQGSEWKIVSLP